MFSLYKKDRLAIKICGISEQTALESAITAKADFVGFVFYPPSPRAITVLQAAMLCNNAKGAIMRVGLFVNPTAQNIAAVLDKAELDVIQLHGDETVERVAEIKKYIALPIIKAFAVSSAQSSAQSFERMLPFKDYIDAFLFDSPPQKNLPDGLPGGTGKSFNWNFLKNFPHKIPWMLAGGLNENNLKTALKESGAKAIDVSSSVEWARGKKSPEKITHFIEAARKIELGK